MGIKGEMLLLIFAAAVAAGAFADPNTASTRENSEWPLLGGNANQWDFSSLTRIRDENVSQLGLAWFADLPVVSGLVGQPLVMEGTVYQGAPGGQIVANDVRTGKELWTFVPPIGDRTNLSWTAIWSTHFNRGAAIDRDHVYIGAGDCRLFAVDRHTGKQVWEAKVCDPVKNYGLTGPVYVGGGMVFLGNTNAEQGTVRGHVDAFDAATGKQLWRFYTMPGDPAAGFENAAMEMASKTWGKEYWKLAVGAAAPWQGMTYDEKLQRLYVGVGNPGPQNPDKRAPGNGDELFTDSIVALDAKTGKYLWHYQEVPRDGWDSDAVSDLTVADLPIAGHMHRVVMQAPKDGFFYVLDAESGKLLSANNYVPNTWASGVDPKTGRIVVRDSGKWWEHPDKPTVIQPGGFGGHSWTLMAYHPTLRLVYVPAFIWPDLYGPEKTSEGDADSEVYALSKNTAFKAMGKLIAWDPIAHKERWHVDQSIRAFNGGVLATAGNLVFQGTADGTFNAYTADTGKRLWTFNSRGTILAAPITVDIDGEQVILVPSGDGGASAGPQVLPQLESAPWAQSRPRLLAFKLGGTATLPPNPPRPEFAKPFLPRQPDELAAKGAELYQGNGCYGCHGENAVKLGAAIPDLRRSSPTAYQSMSAIVIGGVYRQVGMPAFPDLTDKDLEAIKAFLTNRAWKAYDEQERGGSEPHTKN